MIDGLADGPELGHGHKLRLHETASRFLFIGETAFELGPVHRGKVFEDALAAIILEVFENGRCIV